MPNVTISINENLLQSGRQYAHIHNISLNSLIRDLLKQTVINDEKHWIDECFNIMDKAKGNSRGRKWKREELYNV